MNQVGSMAKRKASTTSSRSASRREVKDGLASGGHPALPAVPPPSSSASRWQVIFLGLLLFLLTAWAFLPSLRNGFVDYDDDVYVTANTQVQSGLGLASVVWTLGSTAGGNYWHPLTWLSHMLDCQMYWLKARRAPPDQRLVPLRQHACCSSWCCGG